MNGRVLQTAGLAALAVLIVAGTARADEERVTLSMRGSTLDRDDSGYADHAEVFGLAGAEVGGGGVVEAGVRVAPRVWLYASWSGFTSQGARRLGELRVDNRVLLAQAGLTLFRRDGLFSVRLPFSLRCDVLAGGGLYSMRDELDGESQSVSGPGLRLGGQVTLSWRSFGLIIAFGRHFTRASIEDRVGGGLGAGGNEFGAGLSLRL